MDAAIAGGSEPTRADLAALRTWLTVRDAVLRGLVHTLSNRVGTVIAASGLLDAGGADVAGRVLGGEAERLERLVDAFRLATADPSDTSAVPEPVVLDDALREATALYAHAGETGDQRTELAGVESLPPMLVSRVALTHALLVLLAHARTVRLAVAGDFVTFRMEPATNVGAVDAPRAVDAVVWLLRPSGAYVDDARVVHIPRFGTTEPRTAGP